jgi:hypothetical protein
MEHVSRRNGGYVWAVEYVRRPEHPHKTIRGPRAEL